jgi:hypothetical protein
MVFAVLVASGWIAQPRRVGFIVLQGKSFRFRASVGRQSSMLIWAFFAVLSLGLASVSVVNRQQTSRVA